jgi:hypothetical protein
MQLLATVSFRIAAPRETHGATDSCAEEIGGGLAAINKWVRLNRRQGEQALNGLSRGMHVKNLPEAIRDKILELKKEGPFRGIKRIFFLRASLETVRQTVKEEGLIERPSPRLFEHAKPNQMLQTNIFTVCLVHRHCSYYFQPLFLSCAYPVPKAGDFNAISPRLSIAGLVL